MSSPEHNSFVLDNRDGQINLLSVIVRRARLTIQVDVKLRPFKVKSRRTNIPADPQRCIVLAPT